MKDKPDKHPASYRDPAGFVFLKDGRVYRQVNTSYLDHYKHLMSSGLYDQLTKKGWLIKHEEVAHFSSGKPDAPIILLPEQIPLISYPYEWCFTQLKDAALLTLNIMRASMDKGMILKDATPLNIQFIGARPVFIDTLSFERYDPHQPWIAYRAFCENFLAPLLLNAYLGMESGKLFLSHPDGVPVQDCANWLRFKSRFHSLALLHIHLQKAVTHGGNDPNKNAFSKSKLLRIIEHLAGGIEKLKIPERRTTWNEYYDPAITSAEYLREKEEALKDFLSGIDYRSALDMGCNNGHFTKRLVRESVRVAGTDLDAAAINDFYLSQKNRNDHTALALVCDWLNPGADGGWENAERTNLISRVQSDLVMALALLHHLVLAKNVPFPLIASLLNRLCNKWLVVEFVTKDDERAKEMLERKGDIFPNYHPDAFEEALSEFFHLKKKRDLKGGSRILYLFEKKLG